MERKALSAAPEAVVYDFFQEIVTVKRFLPFVLVILGLLLFAGAMFAMFHQVAASRRNSPLAPATLAHLLATKQVSGNDAMQSIQTLHGTDFGLVDGSVTTYGEQNATLWVSVSDSPESAGELITRMSLRISSGGTPFMMREMLNFNERDIYSLEGMGQLHFYFQSGNKVIWLAADEPIAEQALQEALAFYR